MAERKGCFILSTPSEPFKAAVVARLLGVSVKTVYKWAKEAYLPSRKFGRAVRFDQADVEAFIERGRRKGGED